MIVEVLAVLGLALCWGGMGGPSIPAPPTPPPPPVPVDPEELARRRAAMRAQQTTRDNLVVDPGVASRGMDGTGLRIGG